MFSKIRRFGAAADDRGPLRDDLIGAERLEDRALTLAAHFAVTRRLRARSILPRFEDNARAKARYYASATGAYMTNRLAIRVLPSPTMRPTVAPRR